MPDLPIVISNAILKRDRRNLQWYPVSSASHTPSSSFRLDRSLSCWWGLFSRGWPDEGPVWWHAQRCITVLTLVFQPECAKRLCYLLNKVKTNLSFRQVESIFNLRGDGENSRRRMADAFDSVCDALVIDFAPLHLGSRHLSWAEAIRNDTSFSTEFSGNNVTSIWDGTYIHISKSSPDQINQKDILRPEVRHACWLVFVSRLLHFLDTVTWSSLCL